MFADDDADPTPVTPFVRVGRMRLWVRRLPVPAFANDRV